jgi:TM2 domain-containing membrane protein YozV
MKFFLAAIVLPLFAFSGYSQNLYDFDNSAAFASYLRQTNQYNLAIPEYERLIFMKPGNLLIEKDLLTVYWEAELWEQGITRALNLYPNENTIPNELAFEYLALLFKNKEFNKAKSFAENNSNLHAQERFFYLGTSNALSYNWKAAYKNYRLLKESNFKSAHKYMEISRQALDEKRKSPALAAVMSTFIPGSGKIYTGDWKDGLVALLFVGTTGWQAQRAFHKQGVKSVRGWIFASISFGFHIGNIFGSHKSAKLINLKKDEIHQNKIEHLFYSNF